ncbi:MAG: hypothetical protein L7F78_15665 [Syntrophales bacterium LBB04]|nr:hypothetical protein [Syntrophales bacterium LBB04]
MADDKKDEIVRVRITAEQIVTYRKFVKMSREEWEALKKTPETVMEDEDMSPLSEFLEPHDIDYREDYEDVELIVVDEDGKRTEPKDYYCPE